VSDSRLEISELPGPGRERDGIGEEDHPVPLWFNLSWIATTIFGVAYMIWYLALSDWSSAGEWQAEVAAAATQSATARASQPTTNPYTGNAAAIAEGKEVFMTICIACHMADGHGLVGPSLVDPYWKYGSADADLFATVTEGRPGGMAAWGAQLGNEKIWKVIAFVRTLPKTSEPGFGAPDYVPPAPPAPAAAASP
jgi:cytochrome c oxidase cbb3-type subunit 3